jgi:hypothetical protein
MHATDSRRSKVEAYGTLRGSTFPSWFNRTCAGNLDSLRRQRVHVTNQKEKPENTKVASMFTGCVDGSGSNFHMDMNRSVTK